MTFSPKLLIATAIASLSAICGFNLVARTAGTEFANLPADATPIFNRNMRLDMLDYYYAGITKPIINILGDSSYISHVDKDRLVVATSKRSYIEVAVVPTQKDTVVALIETVLTPTPDSFITFYSTDGDKLESPALPTAKDFAITKDPIYLPQFFVSAQYSPDEKAFIFTSAAADSSMTRANPDIEKSYTQVRKYSYNGRKYIPCDGRK